ncbi:MAG: tetratricopeptide repeat protein [Sneathiellales bacterium]|nr:tetratricopeptide repeat protein [Sneathiellales bacterium]
MKKPAILTVSCFLGLTLALSPVYALAMGGDSDSTAVTPAQAPEYAKGKKQIEQKDWTGAISSFTDVVRKNPKHADAFNYLGYASRQMGEYEKAFAYYREALAINPNHRGANEYIGEAYLQTGNLAMAEKHLSRLDDICTFGCAEYTMLKRAVADYKAKNS